MNRRLALALALPFLALGAQWLLWPWLKPFFWFLFFPAVFFSARLAGRRGGLPATVLSAVLVWYFFLPEPLSWGLKNPENLWSVGLFLAMGYLFSDAHERLRLVRRKTETDFEAVFEQAAVGMAHVSNEGRFLRVNHRFAEIVGRTPAAMTALHFQDITHPDDLPADLEAVRRLQAGEIASFTREKRFRRGEGEYIWARIHIALVRRPDGRPDYRIGVIEDITERKAAEQAFRESEETYHSLFENMLNGFAYCRMLYEDEQPVDFVYLAVNHAFTAQTGLRDVAGRRVSEVIPGIRASDPQLFETYGRVASTGRPERFESYVAALDLWFDVAVYSPAREHFVAVFDVISTRKTAETKLTAALEEQTQSRRAALNLMEDAQAAKAGAEAALGALEASERTYRTLFENLFISVVRCRILFKDDTPVDMEYFAANPAFAEVTGIREDVVGRRISEVIPGYCENNPESLATFGGVARSGEATRWEHYLPALDRWFSFFIYPAGAKDEIVILSDNITDQKKAELVLRESEGRFRALVEQSLAGIYIIQDGLFRYVNPGFAAVFGYDAPEQVIDRVPFTDLVAAQDRERVAENIRRRVDGETEDIHYIFKGRRRDGSLIDVEVHGRTFDYQGRPAVIGLLLDITARKAAEDALRESELRFHDIVDASADWVWEVDAQGRYTYVSESVFDLLGYLPSEIVGKTPFDFMPPEEAERVGAEFAALAAHREPFRDLENVNLRKDGLMVHVASNGMPILDAGGRLLGYRGLDRDITERTLAETKLAEREARYRAVIETSGDGFWMNDAQGRILVVNDVYARMSGYSREELLTMNIAELEVQESPAEVSSHIERIMRNGSDLFETRHVAKDGRLWPVEVNVAFWPEAGGHFFTFLRDIAQRKAAEAELRTRNEELERFNRATVGRELDMIEMKKSINALSKELGREAPYPLRFLNEGDSE